MGDQAEESGRKSREGEEAERVEQKWLPEFSLEMSRARCGLEIGSQGTEDKAGGGITGVGGAMSHFRTWKNETGAEWNWAAGAKVTRSWRKG